MEQKLSVYAYLVFSSKHMRGLISQMTPNCLSGATWLDLVSGLWIESMFVTFRPEYVIVHVRSSLSRQWWKPLLIRRCHFNKFFPRY